MTKHTFQSEISCDTTGNAASSVLSTTKRNSKGPPYRETNCSMPHIYNELKFYPANHACPYY
jgi:hypothetical protein